VLLFRALLLVFLLAGAALLYRAATDDPADPAALERVTAARADQLAALMVAGVEHEMLAGDGVAAGALVARLEKRVADATVRLFDHRGAEVWGPEPPAPHPRDMVPEVVATLTDHQRRMTDAGVIYRPVANDDACARCHREPAELRGVLALTVPPDGCDRAATVTALARAGFTHLMTADQSDRIADYVAELTERADGIRGVAVFGADGERAFGDELAGVDPAAIRRALASERPVDLTGDAGPVRLTRLAMTARCAGCHDDEPGATRGLLAVALAPADGCPTGELETLVDSSLRAMMLARLGRRITDFFDAAAATPGLGTVELFDNTGRRWWTTDHPAPPPEIARALASRDSETRSDASRVEVIRPIASGDDCVRCHGAGDGPRGVIAVSLPAPEAAAARAALPRRRAERAVSAGLGLLLVLGALYLLVRPPRL
jgi:hypothetical protein